MHKNRLTSVAFVDWTALTSPIATGKQKVFITNQSEPTLTMTCGQCNIAVNTSTDIIVFCSNLTDKDMVNTNNTLQTKKRQLCYKKQAF